MCAFKKGVFQMSHLGKNKIAAVVKAASLIIAGIIIDTPQGLAMDKIDVPHKYSEEISTRDVVAKKEEADFETLKLAADKGDMEAQYELGKMYYYGENVEKNYLEAFKHYKLAADQGHVESQDRVVFIFDFLDRGKTAEKFNEIFMHIKSSADHGYEQAQMLLGNVYFNGLYNVNQDYALAFKYFKLSADSGNTDALLRMSQMYERGLGVEKDLTESEKFLRACIKEFVFYDSEELENFIRMATPLFKNLQDADAEPIISALKDISSEKVEAIVSYLSSQIDYIPTGEERGWLIRHLNEFKSPDLNIFLPEAGTDAFWTHNPNNVTQKILLIPSMHTLNFRDVRQDLRKEMKSSQVLIVENCAMEKIVSWDDEKLIRSFMPTIKELKEHELISCNPFLLGNKPWSSYLSQSSLNFLRNNFEPILFPLLQEFKKLHKNNFPHILNKFPMDHVNPLIILGALDLSGKLKSKMKGVDCHIVKYFLLNQQKHIYGLENGLESEDMSYNDKELYLRKHKEYYNIIKESNGYLEIVDGIKNTIDIMIKLDKNIPSRERLDNLLICLNIISSRSQQYNNAYKFSQYGFVDGMEDTYRRNKMWISRLIEKINDNKDSSIVVVVGAAHFVDKFGILNLLAEQGFTFTKF